MALNRKGLALALVNLIPAILIMMNAYAVFNMYFKTGGHWRVSHVLLMIQLVLIAFFFVARVAPKQVSWHPWHVLIALLGTFAPFLFAPTDSPPSVAGIFLQCVGTVMSMWAVISLNRSMGIIPANRGIQTQGLFKYIRHPLYSTYQIANIGYVLNHPTAYNIEVCVLAFACQVMRIFAEERLLMQDPAYVEYRKQVRWKMIPYIF